MELDFARRPDDPYPARVFARLREAGPVVWSETLNGWLVSSFAAVRAVMGDVRQFTMAGTPVAEALGQQAMLVDDTAFHHTVRAVWTRAVSREAIAARADELEGFAAKALASARPALEAGETVNLTGAFREFVMEFIASSFAVPRSRLSVFERWSELSADTPALGLAEGSEAEKRHLAAKAAVMDLLAEQIADRRARIAAGEVPGDLTSLMVAAEGRDGITAENVTDNLFNFILGAMDTTEKWLGNIVVWLDRDPAARAALIADPARIEPFNEELMRFWSVAQTVQRRVREGGAELAGVRLAGGDAVYLMIGAANRDPAEFTDPDSFDPARRHGAHLGFGFGFHHCLGVNIARMEARAFAKVLLETYPRLRVAEADYGESWALWGPRALRVALAPN